MGHTVKLIAALLLVTLSPLVVAQNAEECPRPDAIEMNLDGNAATESQFMDSQAEVRAYADASTLYLECLQQIAANTPEAEQENLLLLYNDMANEMQSTLDAYNRQVRIYTARTSSIDSADDCTRPAAISLNMDGNISTEGQMMEAQSAVQAYAGAANSYLECLQLAAQVVSPEEQDMLVDLYNDMSGELQSTVADFNTQVRAFRARAEAEAAENAQ